MSDHTVDYAELPEVLRILRVNMIDAYMKMNGFHRSEQHYSEDWTWLSGLDTVTTYVDLPDADGFGGGNVKSRADGSWTAQQYDTYVQPFNEIRSTVDSIDRRWNALPDPSALQDANIIANRCRRTITTRATDAEDTYLSAGNLQTQYTQITKYNQADLLAGQAIDAFTTSCLNVLPLAVDALAVFAARRQVLIGLQQGALEGARRQVIATLKGNSDQFAKIAHSQPQWQANIDHAGELLFEAAFDAAGAVTGGQAKTAVALLSVGWDTFQGLREAVGGSVIDVVPNSAFDDQVAAMKQNLDDIDSNIRRLEDKIADIAQSFCDTLAGGIKDHLTATGYVTSDFITSDEVGTIVRMDPEAVGAIVEALDGNSGNVDSIYDQLAEAMKYAEVDLSNATYRTRVGRLSYGASPAIGEMGLLIAAQLKDFMWETHNAASNLKAAFEDFSAAEAESSRALTEFEASLDTSAQSFDPASALQSESQRQRNAASPSDRHLYNIAALMGDDA